MRNLRVCKLQAMSLCLTLLDDFAALQQATSGSAKRAVAEAKTIKVAINGFGRIGRNFVRCWHGRVNSPLEVVAINDTGGVKQVRGDFALGCAIPRIRLFMWLSASGFGFCRPLTS